MRVFLENSQHAGAGADVKRIKSGHLRRSQSKDCRSSGARLVMEDTLPQIIRGHYTNGALFSGVAPSFVIRKEEGPISDNRPAQASPKYVAEKFGPRDFRLSYFRGTGNYRKVIRTKNARPVIKKVISGKDGVAMKLIKRAMPFVGSGFCD